MHGSRRWLGEQGLVALLVTDLVNVRWLSGFPSLDKQLTVVA